MLTHEKLVPNDPIGIRISIGEGDACPLIGSDFVAISVLGARNGPNASLNLMGTEVLGSAAAGSPRMEALALNDGDYVTLDVVTAKDAGGGENMVKRFIEAVTRKASRSNNKKAGGSFSSWKFHIEHGAQQYCATSEPFDLLQVSIIWCPGDAYISFQVMSISGLPDGSTQGRDWDKGKLTSGQSLRIRVEGLI